MKTLIIDDMPLALASLRADLEEHPEIAVVGEANGVMEAAKLIKKLKPELIFLDIHMGDGDGFDLLEIIADEQLQVIFTTASTDHAIKAFSFNAVDYLLKPIDPQRLAQAIAKVKPPSAPAQNTAQGAIALNTQEEIRLVNIADIIRLEAMGNYTTFHVMGAPKILVTRTLKDFEKTLPGHFMRVHQSHLVNRHMITAYIKTEGGYLKMKDDSDVPVSVRKKAQVMELLKK